MPTWATALGIGTCGMAVAAERGPSADRHHATLNVPRDEQRLPDAQHEHDGLVLRLGRPPRVRQVGAYAGVGFNGTSVQLESPSPLSGLVTALCSTYRGSGGGYAHWILRTPARLGLTAEPYGRPQLLAGSSHGDGHAQTDRGF